MFTLLFSLMVVVELLITAVVTVHVFTPEMFLVELGIPWLALMPGLTVIAPVWCLLASLFGSI
jgi:hypothetical protein